MHHKFLENGVALFLEPIPYVRSVTIGLWFKAGSASEIAQSNGISHLLEHIFFKGTGKRSCKQIVEEIESVGGTINAFTSREYTCIYAKVLDLHLEKAVELLADVSLNSIFAEVEKEKQVIVQEIRAAEDSPEEHLHDLFVNTLWPNHPLGFRVAGSVDSVMRLSRDDAIAYYNKWYNATNAVITAAGNLDPERCFKIIQDSFGGMPKPPAQAEESVPGAMSAAVAHFKKLSQVHICLGFPSISARDPRRYALNLLGNALGGSAISRLFQKVREELGLAYNIYTFYDLLMNTGLFGIYAACASKNLNKVIEVLLAEIRDLTSNPMPSLELSNNKEQLKGSITLGLESTFSRVVRSGKSLLYHETVEEIDELLDHIDRVTAEDVMKVASEVLDLNKLNVVTLGPVSDLRRTPLRSIIGEKASAAS